MATILLALGSNLRHPQCGAPAGVLRAAIAALVTEGFAIEAVSAIYRTAPLGPQQPLYANAALMTATSLAPQELMALLHRVEAAFGRMRRRPWGPRVLDLDIIAYGNHIFPNQWQWVRARGLTVPHPQMHHRTFVLRPLVEIAPSWRHPRLNLTVRQLAARVSRRGMMRCQNL